jgi:hypothetical protein
MVRYGFLAGDDTYYITADKIGYKSAKTDNIDLSGKKSDEIFGKDIKLKPKDLLADEKNQKKKKLVTLKKNHLI